MDKASAYSIKSEAFPITFLIILGSIDCLTTITGVLYRGAVERNPFMSGIVNTNIAAFMIVKLSAVFLIGSTYLLTKIILNRTQNKQSKSFRYLKTFMRFLYFGLIAYFVVVVTNNFAVLLF